MLFNEISPEELWIAFGTGSNFHYIPVHEVAAAMDPKVCATLHVFHAFTGIFIWGERQEDSLEHMESFY